MQDYIIKYLREAPGYISGEEMSRQLNISRAAIWKHMHQLREIGYEIEAVPHLGYRLTSIPDKLIPEEIQHGLSTKKFARHIVSFDTVPSTMDEAFRLGMDGASEGTLVCAETQTKGRGRLGRAWMSPKGKGLYFSLILRPKLAPAQMPQLTLMCAVAIAQALNELLHVNATIKWPNDVLIDGKKVAGILTELRAEVDQMTFMVIGAGINVNSVASQLVDTATSLKIATEKNVDRVEVLRTVLRELESWYNKVSQGDFSLMLKQWKKLSATLNKRVRVVDGAGTVEGIAIDIDKDGALLIKKDTGVIVKKFAGDVIALR